MTRLPAAPRSTDVLLVQPPLDAPDFVSSLSGTLYMPRDIVKACLNPGLLSLASYLDDRGYAVRILDLAEDPALTTLARERREAPPRLVGISCTSAFEYLGTLACAAAARELWPGVPVIVGGQHVGPLGTQVFADSACVDFVCLYEGEVVLERLLAGLRDGGVAPGSIAGLAYRVGGRAAANAAFPELVSLDDMPRPRYELYPTYRRYTPFVEESRGCPYGCRYCIASYINERRIRTKSPEKIRDELAYARRLWGDEPEYALLASTFGVRSEAVLRLAPMLRELGVRWNTEIRPECKWERWLRELQGAGLTVLNFGVESACKAILLTMGRTADPDAYLARIRELLAYSAELRLQTRCNFMVYAGDTPATLRDTLAFLLEASPSISAIEYSPLFVIPGTPLARGFEALAARVGCSLVQGDYWNRVHLYPCNPSQELTFQESVAYAGIVERMFSTPEGWYQAEKTMYPQGDRAAIERVRDKLLAARFPGTRALERASAPDGAPP